MIDKSKTNVLTLNSIFTIRIPHSGEHAFATNGVTPYKGYGTKMYNYKGTYLNDELEFISKELSKNTFASSKLVKFSFDVYALKFVDGEIKDKKLILASASPRRKDLLTEFGFNFTTIVSDYEETVRLLTEYMENGCQLKDKYRQRIDSFFAFNDQNNCQRVFEKILEAKD